MSELVRDIKNNSSNFINQKQWVKGKFAWQEGYGVFSYSESHVDNVIKYIDKQEEHHRIRSFRSEYVEYLESYKIEYDNKYLFQWIE